MKTKGINILEKGSSGKDATVLRRNIPLLGAYIAPRTQTERLVAQIWCDALDMDEISITDAYEDLGGDSVLAASIFVEIEKTFGIRIPVSSLVKTPTVQHLSRWIDDLVSKSRK